MEEQKQKKPSKKTSKEVLLILAKKIKIMDEQMNSLRSRVNELEDHVEDLEEALREERQVHFRGDSDYDW